MPVEVVLQGVDGGGVLTNPLDDPVVRVVLAAALGLFLGLEREWSRKSAGIRTFSLISLVGAVFTIVAQESDLGVSLLTIGGVLVIVQGVLLAVQGLRNGEEDSLSLTTSMSMMAAYGVGVLVAAGYVLVGVSVAVVSSLLLVLKRELHGFAGGLTREEMRSSVEFAILAFVVYPLLPASYEVDLVGEFTFRLEPQVAWLMVVTVAGIGIVNYALVRSYGGRGVAVTGFFGGLASSTAVVGTMLDQVRQRADAVSFAVAGVLLADAAMATRNLLIAVAFTVASGQPPLVGAVIPLGVLIVGSFVVAWLAADWGAEVDMDLESPFSLWNVLAFGAVFLVILVGGTVAQQEFGNVGFYVSALLSGLVSSAGTTTSAVLLYRQGSLGVQPAVISILLATGSSILVKAGLAAAGPEQFRNRVAVWSLVLLAAAGTATAATFAIFAPT
ncbi:MgtC/SapB family protein [Halobium salinum]|uniref:MgtC/SapB family protein n=1 Tax=Halobium salinum TaxID=1364940 RepID=A0ABD5PDP4_9EURY|nr:MgtC/SapB family protein [Halobium salinum]